MRNVDLKRLEEILGYQFKDTDLLTLAVTHASLAENRLESNERMEFLGDAILGMVICDTLFRRFPELLEGELTKIKSTVVSRKTCAEVAWEMQFEELVLLGKGMSNRRALPGSVVAATFEALIGAVFLDGGIEAARTFILRVLEPRIELAARSGHQSNFKSVLQQTTQQVLAHIPQYLVLDEQGPDHAKCFQVCVELGGRRHTPSWGSSKKDAEQDAALHALLELDFAHRDEHGDVNIRSIEELLAQQR